MMAYLESLTLHNFRNYQSVQAAELKSGFVILTGKNGAGKTNMLEAVSLLTPGRGIRQAKIQDMRLQRQESLWAISAHVQSHVGSVPIGTGEDASGKSRLVKVNGVALKSVSALSDYLSAVWFVPSMSNLFIGGSTERRRFFDRLVFSLDASHAGRLRRFEKAMSDRSRILKDAYTHKTKPDTQWLDSLEHNMAETAVAISASRLDMLGYLQDYCNRQDEINFPVAHLSLLNGPESELQKCSALQCEENLSESLRRSREKDGITGGASYGVHKTDFHVVYASKKMPAEHCSTGEQKALLTSVILAHALMSEAHKGAMPLLLLDEIAAHLDPVRREALFEILSSLKGQIWMTGTEKALFSSVKEAVFLEVEGAQIKQGHSA